MRVAPIGLLYWRDQEKLLEVARASSILTHGHPAGIEGAAAAALLVAMALEKKTPEKMHAKLTELLGGRAVDLDIRLAQLPKMISYPPEVALSEGGLGESWVAEEAVVSALYCFWRSPADFAETVITAANTDGDSDSIACIAGSISGAFNGINCIPQHWREGVEDAEMLLDLASQLEERSRQQR
jgi:ADP-ribosylglycohydrolase